MAKKILVDAPDDGDSVRGPSVGAEFAPWMVDAGKDLIRALDQTGMSITSALWLYQADHGVWRLMLATPEVRKIGPRKLYERIHRALSRQTAEHPLLHLEDVSVVDPNEQIIGLIRTVFKTNPRAIGSIRATRNVINGQFIEDALIYRSS